MITIKDYISPASAAEAYARLAAEEDAVVIGGGLFLRLGSRKIGTAVDLCRAGLEFIRETGDTIEIGAMTTFRQLEKSALLQRHLDGLIPAAVANLPGVQLKNMATVGGTVFGRIGFSELLTALLALDCRVVLHQGGEMLLPEFLAGKGRQRDILEKVVLAKRRLRASWQTFRSSAGGLPILSVAVTRGEGRYRVAVGGRPGAAVLAERAAAYLAGCGAADEAGAGEAAGLAASSLQFGSDRRASAEYRRELCKVLVRRAVVEVQG